MANEGQRNFLLVLKCSTLVLVGSLVLKSVCPRTVSSEEIHFVDHEDCLEG